MLSDILYIMYESDGMSNMTIAMWSTMKQHSSLLPSIVVVVDIIFSLAIEGFWSNEDKLHIVLDIW
jgi:hypothetical protein